MQEEIENRTVNLAISTTKLTARGIIRLAAKGLAYIKRKSREAALKNEKPDGRQTIQQLIGQNQGVTNIDISQTDLKGFEKYACKYGVDYAITKDKSVFPRYFPTFCLVCSAPISGRHGVWRRARMLLNGCCRFSRRQELRSAIPFRAFILSIC